MRVWIPGTTISRAHPRSRGEHQSPFTLDALIWGSSPLARGTSKTRSSSCLFPGLIPARAGNIKCRRIPVKAFRAHPRSRGEHCCRAVRVSIVEGSSPLARGTSQVIVLVLHLRGLIPARAGNISRAAAVFGPGWAHPRSRGEHRCGARRGARW